MASKRTLCAIILCFSFFFAGFSFGRKGKAYSDFRSFTREQHVLVEMLDDSWAYGVDAIGIVHLPSTGGPICHFFYRETDSFTWNKFYSHKIPLE